MGAVTAARYTIALGSPADVDRAVAIDDAASELYESAAIVFDLAPDHPFIVGERVDWITSAEGGGLFFAVAADARNADKVAFIAMDEKDGAAYLEQISVLPAHMRCGIGTMLLDKALAWSRERGFAALWLTTYDHLNWNRAYYECFGFVLVPEDACGPDIRAVLADQRAALPAPDHRIAMRKAL